MDDRPITVSALVARFQLRRRASSEAFRTGVRLARTGFVSIGVIEAGLVSAEVHDPSPMHVELYVDKNSLVGRCPCPAAMHSVCRHQVAVAHTVWVTGRRYRRTEADGSEGPA